MNGMKEKKMKKITVEKVIEKVRPPHPKKKEEVPLENLWEHLEHIYSTENNLPPDKWDFQDLRKK